MDLRNSPRCRVSAFDTLFDGLQAPIEGRAA
jgi:hypothetical protein